MAITRVGGIRVNGVWIDEPDWPNVAYVLKDTEFDNGDQTGTLNVPQSDDPKYYAIYYTKDGVITTGLTPTVTVYKAISDGSTILPTPTITELGNGVYTFTASPTTPSVIIIDSGDVTMGHLDRYKIVRVNPYDNYLDNKVSEVYSDTTAIKAQTDLMRFTNNDIKATLDGETVEVNSFTTSAKADLQSEANDALLAYDSNQGVATQSSVNSIQNNTQFVASLPMNPLIPSTGNNVYVCTVYFYDNIGHMENPDNSEISVNILTPDSVSKNTLLYQDTTIITPLEDSITFSGYKKLVYMDTPGLYFFVLSIPSTEVISQYIYDFVLTEGTNEMHYNRTHMIYQTSEGNTLDANVELIKEIVDKLDTVMEETSAGSGLYRFKNTTLKMINNLNGSIL